MKNAINLYSLAYEADKISRTEGNITIHITKDVKTNKFYAFLCGLWQSPSCYKTFEGVKRRLERFKVKYRFNYDIDYLEAQNTQCEMKI